jgi:hypothetical protein
MKTLRPAGVTICLGFDQCFDALFQLSTYQRAELLKNAVIVLAIRLSRITGGPQVAKRLNQMLGGGVFVLLSAGICLGTLIGTRRSRPCSFWVKG